MNAALAKPAFDHPPRVLLLLNSLGGGGAERVALNLARHCDPAVCDVRLGLLHREGPYLAEFDRTRIVGPPRRGESFKDHVTAPLAIAAMIRRAQPEVVMTFGPWLEVQTFWAMRLLGGSAPRWICRQDNNRAAEIGDLTSSRAARAALSAVLSLAHSGADARVAVSRGMAARLSARGAAPPTRVIHNPIDLELIQRRAAASPACATERPFVVAAGRLVRQKGFDVLISAFAGAPAAAGLDLVILGQGPLEAALRAQAAALGLADRVHFPGFQVNPWAWFARARLFVLASRWEGFGNVVAEALACGAPALVTDCDFGPSEQVEHGRSGWVALAGDADALARAMDLLLANRVHCARLRAAARIRARAFDIGAAARAYEELFIAEAKARRLARRSSGAVEIEFEASPVLEPLAA
ncbi:MAG TPA: glycosyltransferase [Caulobacteraceae bacterium]|nr:glycosyltransferase [Caulobacteraceae bacterium]